MKPEITDDTMGFVVVIENKLGGKGGSWHPDFDNAFEQIKRTWNTNDNYIRIFPSKYKDRMSRIK